MTDYEIARYRKDLQRAVAFFDSKTPVPTVRGALQAKLDAVIAEQDERARIRYANSS